ncbi:sulfotransferase family protein [Gloeocapsopsis dulcis]|uniref:Sulfotransferase family protein n=1 Tax=Gloeocapsopsis dulcis AAB1 = 1H9 TaxID=1433147 RepID=A0A6N8FYI1_9CHRO|nr:sulfotransferase [Gloeocapsopsis dulcis]MUL38133.1 sulfotransferase family protein [Gloeocapsopsis dulcis AAB1 = 1H9]WNN89395.1 sulfotransferase [Gloeocapsopsis dulcis]
MTGTLHNFTFEHPYRPLWLRGINWTGETLKQNGISLVDLSEASLLTAASSKTGLSNWGDESFRLPLRTLLESLEKDAALNLFGRYFMRKLCIQLLSNRLRIQEDLKHYPEILQVPIARPLFILGMPRSGTTLLHNLLAQDPASRWLHLWEMASPSPPPEYHNRNSDPRIQRVEKFVKRYNTLAPQLTTVHNLNPKGPEECNPLFEHEFTSPIFEIRANVKCYAEWLETYDLVRAYQFYRQQLQLLAWHYPPDSHWVFKAPAHIFYLDALIKVFPDACIVQTHRDPLKVLPSICSLTAIVRGIYSDRIEPKTLGKYWSDRIAKALVREMQVRDSEQSSRFYDVHYHTLVQDPIGIVRQIYAYFGYEFHPQMAENIKTWLAQNPQHKHGVHRYSLEQFGLDPEKVNAQFAKYCEKFNVRRE